MTQSKPHSVQTNVGDTLKDNLEEAAKVNGVPEAEITRNILWSFFQEHGDTVLPGHQETMTKREQLKRENKPILVRGDYRNKVWSHMKEQLDKPFPPEPGVFDEQLNSWRKEADEYPESDEYKTFCNFCLLIYKVCHPSAGHTHQMLDDIFYLIERGSIMGGDETAMLVRDFLESNAGIPNIYIVAAWRAGTSMYLEDERRRYGENLSYYRDEEPVRLGSEGER